MINQTRSCDNVLDLKVIENKFGSSKEKWSSIFNDIMVNLFLLFARYLFFIGNIS